MLAVESATIAGRRENGYAALGRLDAMIMGLVRWERLGSTMTGGSANRLMASARRRHYLGDCLSPSFATASLTKPTMIAVIAPNCLMAGKWMIIVAERPDGDNLTGASSFDHVTDTVLLLSWTARGNRGRERSDEEVEGSRGCFRTIRLRRWRHDFLSSWSFGGVSLIRSREDDGLIG